MTDARDRPDLFGEVLPDCTRDRPDPFGEVLPDRTRDEENAGWGDREHDEDERLRREVPPHHG